MSFSLQDKTLVVSFIVREPDCCNRILGRSWIRDSIQDRSVDLNVYCDSPDVRNLSEKHGRVFRDYGFEILVILKGLLELL